MEIDHERTQDFQCEVCDHWLALSCTLHHLTSMVQPTGHTGMDQTGMGQTGMGKWLHFHVRGGEYYASENVFPEVKLRSQ